MKIGVFYNSKSALESSLSAYQVYLKYNTQVDKNGNTNEVDLYDIAGLTQATVTTHISALTATYHRIFILSAVGTTDGTISAAHESSLLSLLLGSTADVLSDDHLMVFAPASFPCTGYNQAQAVWIALFAFGLLPTAITGKASLQTNEATAGGATSLTDSGATLAVNGLTGQYLYIIGGTGAGQCRPIISNTATVFTVAAWSTNPDNTSIYIVTPSQHKPFPEALQFIGGGGSEVAYNLGTVGGSTTTITDSGQAWTAHQFLGLGYQVYIYAGTGAGQYATITDNTGTTSLTVASWSVATPDSTSKFVVVQNLGNVLIWQYLTRWLWVYASNPANSTCISYLEKLYDNMGTIGTQGVAFASGQDLNFLKNIVLHQGKAMYDASIYHQALISPRESFASQTSGVLIPGKTYYIATYGAGDSFTNVAKLISGTINTTGCTFLAMGTTPTTYSNSSVLITVE